MVLPSPRNTLVRPVHELGDRGHGGIDLLSLGSSTALVCCFTGKDHVCCVLLRELVLGLGWSSILGWRWGWRWKRFASHNAPSEITLPSCMPSRLAKTTMHLARLIQHVFKGVLGLRRPLRLCN